MSSKLPQTVLAANHPEVFIESIDTSRLAKWMHDVLIELDAVRKHFKPHHVHDFRVALRRCRSLALGLSELDPGTAWTRLRKEAKTPLVALSNLRDAAVMRGWITRLRVNDQPSTDRLLAWLDQYQQGAIKRADKELSNFDKKQWRKWTHQLPTRAARVCTDSPAAELLVLERWREAWAAHSYAFRTRSKVSLHGLRIALKRFRYSVENFLPSHYAEWGQELKKFQDLLGEIHDLDVLWATIVRLKPAVPAPIRAKWQAAIEPERSRRLAAYRAKMTGPKSRFTAWRAALPEGESLERARLDWLAVWASFLDPDFSHSAYVAKIATLLFDAILDSGVPIILPVKARRHLEAAAILHDVGRAEGSHNHQKKSYRMIREKNPPPGWTAAEMEIVASIARYHRGALPEAGQKNWAAVPADQQESVLLLAGILRLATALGSDGNTVISRIKAESAEEPVGSLVLRVSGYSGEEPLASRLAAARHLLESVLHRPIVIEPEASRALGISAAV
jgi:exopolyphosphatase/guanosine-5'-triphosphate,3'-diphosphate pyrophosphatase